MPLHWKIGPSVIWIRIEGYAAYGLRETIAQVIASPLYKPNQSLLLDRTGATDTPSSDELRMRAREIRNLSLYQCAILVGAKPQDLQFGRLLREFLKSEGIGSEVFTDAAEAKRWLSSEEEKHAKTV